MTVKQCNF